MLHRLIDAELHVLAPPADGLMLSRRLADRLALHPGDRVAVEVLEGRRPHVDMTVVGLLDEVLGIGAYADIDTVNRLMGESDAVNSVGVAVAGDTGTLRRLLKDRPKVATITERAVSLRQFRQTTQMFVLVMAGIMSVFSVMIAVGVVYNHARIALQERAWELASLRVLGFTRAEVAGPPAERTFSAAADRGASRPVVWPLAGPRDDCAARERDVHDPRRDPPALLCAGGCGGAARGRGQRADCSPARRSAGSGLCAEDAGVARCD